MTTVIPIEDQIKEVKREIGMRESVYKRRVTGGQMPEAEMTKKIALMRAVLATLERVQKDTMKQGNLSL